MSIDSFDKEIENAQNANSQSPTNETQTETTEQNPINEVAHSIDYKVKFSESSKEALRLLEENRLKDEENARLKRIVEEKTQVEQIQHSTENLYPGFEDLDEEAKQNLIAYTNSITEKAKKEIYQDPAIAFSRQLYNEKKFDEALDKIVAQYPELNNSRAEFKSKYYNPNDVPSNIENILADVSKIYLFDKAKSIGAEEQRQISERMDTERNTGGDRTPSVSRSLEDWQRMAQENPSKFAKLSKEYADDLKSGKI